MFTSYLSFASALGNYGGNEPFYDASIVGSNEDTLEIAWNLKDDWLSSNSAFAKIRDFFGLWGYSNEQQPAIVYIRNIVNLLLGLVSFVSLIVIISAFYLIFFSKQEEGLAKAKKMLIGVAIALAVMGLSWLITSYFYNIYSIATWAI